MSDGTDELPTSARAQLEQYAMAQGLTQTAATVLVDRCVMEELSSSRHERDATMFLRRMARINGDDFAAQVRRIVRRTGPLR